MTLDPIGPLPPGTAPLMEFPGSPKEKPGGFYSCLSTFFLAPLTSDVCLVHGEGKVPEKRTFFYSLLCPYPAAAVRNCAQWRVQAGWALLLPPRAYCLEGWLTGTDTSFPAPCIPGRAAHSLPSMESGLGDAFLLLHLSICSRHQIHQVSRIRLSDGPETLFPMEVLGNNGSAFLKSALT